MIVASLLLILVAITLLVLGLADGASQLLVGSIGASLLAAIALVIGARQAAAARAALDEERDAGEPDLAHVGARERVAAGAPAGAPRGGGRTGTTGMGEAADMTGAAGGRPGGARTATAQATTETFPTVPPDEGLGPLATPGEAATAPAGGPDQPPPTAAPSYAAMPDADLIGGEADLIGGEEEDPPDEPAPQRVSPADAARVARMSTDVLVIDGRPRYHLAGCVHLLGRDSEPLPVGEAIELGFTPCGLCEPDTALLS